MTTPLARNLSLLRKEKGTSQRAAAQALAISQALLSHYEKGAREPGLAFVCRACSYYGVSADFLLGRTMDRQGSTLSPHELHDAGLDKDNRLRGSVSALLHKKLVINAISLLMDVLGRAGDTGVIGPVAAYLGAAVYTVYRHIYGANVQNLSQTFSYAEPLCYFTARADMARSEAEIAAQLAQVAQRTKGDSVFPVISNAWLTEEYPALAQSLLTVLHQTEQRMQQQSL